jgi:hypothetical protein
LRWPTSNEGPPQGAVHIQSSASQFVALYPFVKPFRLFVTVKLPSAFAETLR